MSKKALTCKVKKGVLTIEVGIRTVKFAAEHLEDFWQPETDKVALVVSDPAKFANDVRSALIDEEEDGSTPISRMLDAAIRQAVEQGSDGLDYDAMDKLEEAERRAELGEERD